MVPGCEIKACFDLLLVHVFLLLGLGSELSKCQKSGTGLSQLIPHSISADTCDTGGCDDGSSGGVM